MNVTKLANDKHQLVAVASIGLAIAVMGIKYVAYLLTGSVALFSDALESIVNVLTAIAALIAIRVAAQPPDRRHPFGHHKAEYFAAVLQGALIIVAALAIFHEAYGALREPRALDEPALGLLVNGLATGINCAWALLLINRGAAWKSPALSGDGHHIMTDVITSVGVLVGLILATLTGWSILDPLIAIAVAINILRIGYGLTTKSMSQLMDEAPPRRSRRASAPPSRPTPTARCRRTTSARAPPGPPPSSSSTWWCRAPCRWRPPTPSATVWRAPSIADQGGRCGHPRGARVQGQAQGRRRRLAVRARIPA